MDQDETWHGGMPRPNHIVLDGDPPTPKGAQHLPLFSPYLLWPKGCINQDATWGSPQPRPHCVGWAPSSPSWKGHNSSLFGPCLLWPNGRPSQLLLSTCLCCCGRLKELEEQYAKEKMEHERLFAQQREVGVGFIRLYFWLFRTNIGQSAVLKNVFWWQACSLFADVC